MTIIDLLYMLSAFIFPIFYAPQIRKLLRDHSGSIHYSYQKASAHLLLRVLAMAYAVGHGLTEMAVVVGLDMVARSTELGIAYFVHGKHTQANRPPKSEPAEAPGVEIASPPVTLLASEIRPTQSDSMTTQTDDAPQAARAKKPAVRKDRGATRPRKTAKGPEAPIPKSRVELEPLVATGPIS